MKVSLNSFTNFPLGATDGEIGKIMEMYFDDNTWTVRYLVVRAGSWLFGRVVLISPDTLVKPDWREGLFKTTLSIQEIKESPGVEMDKPVYRQEEDKRDDPFQWMIYQGHGIGGAGILMPSMQVLNAIESEKTEGSDRHLRSSGKVTGYQIHATDGEIGRIHDFVINTVTWKVEFLIIETGAWHSKRKIILSPDWIKSINWETSRVIVDVSVETIKNSPDFDDKNPVNEVFEKALRDYYGRLIR